MTRLITIDYTEYLDLIKCKNNIKVTVYEELIKEIENLHRMLDNNIYEKQISKKDLFSMLSHIRNTIGVRKNFIKEEVNNE